VDSEGRQREVVARPAFAGSLLVIDRDSATLGDRRLVAHLAADEPAENAMLVCRRYIEDGHAGRYRPRTVTAADFEVEPLAGQAEGAGPGAPEAEESAHLDRTDCSFRLGPSQRSSLSIPELRWRRLPAGAPEGRSTVLSLRDVVAKLQSYEPACSLTERALLAHEDAAGMSISVLRLELVRVRESPIVLNRALREEVLRTLERRELSMSQIAIRCGRVKRDCKGNESGETSWLARRVGLLPEGGQSAPTPWIHSDVLALIARRGLGVSPREVEL